MQSGASERVRRPRTTSLSSRSVISRGLDHDPDYAQGSWRRHPDSNRGIRVLQTLALPLGYAAAKQLKGGDLYRIGEGDSSPQGSVGPSPCAVSPTVSEFCYHHAAGSSPHEVSKDRAALDHTVQGCLP